eukprot:3139046-Amphidinium_carterae.1
MQRTILVRILYSVFTHFEGSYPFSVYGISHYRVYPTAGSLPKPEFILIEGYLPKLADRPARAERPVRKGKSALTQN